MLYLTFGYLQKIFLSFADICKFCPLDVTGARCQGVSVFLIMMM